MAFTGQSNNLVSGDTNGKLDIFVHDRVSGVTERVSVDSAGVQGDDDCLVPAISGDGRYVAFLSHATNLVAGDTNGFGDIFVHDRQTGTTQRVSVSTAGAEGNDQSQTPTISADGRYIAFSSLASNLVPGDTNGAYDIFVRDLTTGMTERVSIDYAGAQGNSTSARPLVSADGRYVAFESAADNLVLGDAHAALFDIFVHDRQTGATERASIDSSGLQANADSAFASISADGRYVAFTSDADNLVGGDTNQAQDIFLHDRVSGVTQRVDVTPSGSETLAFATSASPSVSADGSYVSFISFSSNLVPNDTGGVLHTFVHVLQTGETTRVSVASSGAAANGNSSYSAISGDGRYVAFTNTAANLVPGDTNGHDDVFVRDWFQPAVVSSAPATEVVPRVRARTRDRSVTVVRTR